MEKILSKIKYYINKPEIDYGAFYRKRDTDYEIVGNTEDILSKLPPARNRFSGVQYHQPSVSAVSCTVHGAATALSALTGITFTVEDRKRIWDQMKADGTGSEVWGGYVDSAVKKWRDWWNETWKNDPSKQIDFISVEMGSAQMYKLIEKGYVIDMSYRWVEGYNEDWIYDGIVNQQWDADDSLEYYGAYGDMGHCLALVQSDVYGFMYKDKFYNLLNIDSYSESVNRKNNNMYAIDKSVVPRLVDVMIRVWNNNGYVFYFRQDFEESKIEIDKKLLARLSKAQIDSGRFVNLHGTNRYGIVQFGKLIELKGKDLSEGFALRNGSINESLVLPLTKEKWISIGGSKK